MAIDSVFSRITARMSELTPNEAKIADYCLHHPEGVIDNSIHDVARETGVSVASVSRLASTLGYRDWKEVRLALAREVAVRDNPVYPKIGAGEPEELVIEKVFDGAALSVRETFFKLDRGKVIEVARRVSEADSVLFFGSGGSGYIALDEALRFSHLRVSAYAFTEAYVMMLQAAKMHVGQVAFGISHSGRTRSTVEVMGEARRNGAVTVGVSNFSDTPLEEVSDYYFQTAFPGGGGKTAALTARAAIVTIMDAVYVLAAQFGSISERFGYMDEVLESSLRVPPGGRSRRKKK